MTKFCAKISQTHLIKLKKKKKNNVNKLNNKIDNASNKKSATKVIEVVIILQRLI